MTDNFNSGYTRALLDLQNFFEQHGYSWSRQSLKTLVQLFIDNRKELRERGEIHGFSWSKKDGFCIKK